MGHSLSRIAEDLVRAAKGNSLQWQGTTLATHFQPIYSVREAGCIGFEALVRLPAADGSLIPPMIFIPIAEDMRVIDKIGTWVLREACRTAVTWPEPLTVAVNLSPAQFHTAKRVVRLRATRA